MTTIIWQEINTRLGILCVHGVEKKIQGVWEKWWAVTLNDNKSPVKGVLATYQTREEAMAFLRGVHQGIDILR